MNTFRSWICIGSLLLLSGSWVGLEATEDPTSPSGLKNLECNTDANEDDPHLSSDGRTLFYSSDEAGKWSHMVSTRRLVTVPWSAGAPFKEEYVISEVDDRSVFLTLQGVYPQYLYFATKTDKEVNNYDIYAAVRLNAKGAFSAKTPLNTISTEADELHPCLTSNGRQLYFSRKTDMGWRVLVCSRTDVTGAAGFGQPTVIEELPPGFHHPCVSRDGQKMYLQGPVGKDQWGLFISELQGRKWQKPVPLLLGGKGKTIGDTSPSLSANGLELYFASDREGGKGKMDLWVVPVLGLKRGQ